MTEGIRFHGGITFLDEIGCIVTSGLNTMVFERFMIFDFADCAAELGVRSKDELPGAFGVSIALALALEEEDEGPDLMGAPAGAGGKSSWF